MAALSGDADVRVHELVGGDVLGREAFLGGWRWAVKIGVTMSIIRCTRAVSKFPRVLSGPLVTKSERIFSMA